MGSARAISADRSANIFRAVDLLSLSKIEVTQSSLCVTGTLCEVIGAVALVPYASCALVDTAYNFGTGDLQIRYSTSFQKIWKM